MEVPIPRWSTGMEIRQEELRLKRLAFLEMRQVIFVTGTLLMYLFESLTSTDLGSVAAVGSKQSYTYL